MKNACCHRLLADGLLAVAVGLLALLLCGGYVSTWILLKKTRDTSQDHCFSVRGKVDRY
jgi:hypothetical protein